MGNEINFNAVETQEQQFANLLAMTGNGNVKGTFFGSETHNFGSLVDGAGETGSMPVNGVALGDLVLGVSAGVDLVDMTLTAYVQAADVVEYRLQNESGATVDLASTTIRVLVADVT